MSPISANADEYLPLIGLDMIYVAEVTQDNDGGYVADTPEYLADAAEANIETTQSMDTYHLNDVPKLSIQSEGRTTVTLKLGGVPMAMVAKLTGKVFDAVSGRLVDVNRQPPDVALSFRSMKSNQDKYQYIQYLKGNFSIPKVPRITKGEKAEPQWTELVFTAIHTKHKFNTGSVTETVKGVIGDEDTENFSGASWFSQVQTPGVSAPSALQLSSSVPTDGATGVSVSANQSLTFNNALVAEAVNMVFLSKSTDGTLITMTSGYPQLDSTKKIMTLDPASNLTAATAYKISYAVKDIYGQWLQGIVDFTTA